MLKQLLAENVPLLKSKIAADLMQHELLQSMFLGSWDEFLEKNGRESTDTSPATEPWIG